MKGFAVALGLLGLFLIDSDQVFGFAPPRPKPSAPIPTPLPVQPHGELKIKILSYNVQGLPMPWMSTSHLRDIGKILAERRRQGSAPHIVAIQEAFHQDIAHLINEAGYPYRKDGPGPGSGRSTGSGLIVLSEFPIIARAQMIFDYNNTAGVDWNANKGVLYTKIRIPGAPEPLELLNTHMQSDYDNPLTPLSATQGARRRQIREAGDFMWRTASRNGPLVFVGDFNTYSTLGDYYDIIAQTFLTDAAETCVINSSCKTNVDPMNEIRTSLDHQFYRTNTTIKIEPLSYEKTFREPYNGRTLSDHEGVEVDYRVSW